MKIAIIGYGKEGKANEAYFSKQRSTEVEPAEQGSDGAGRASGNEIEVIEPYKDEDYAKIDWGQYDLVLRSPSVRPQPGFSSATQYFFDHCPAPIIGVTGTKGKGTTCSMIAAMLEALEKFRKRSRRRKQRNPRRSKMTRKIVVFLIKNINVL